MSYEMLLDIIETHIAEEWRLYYVQRGLDDWERGKVTKWSKVKRRLGL